MDKLDGDQTNPNYRYGCWAGNKQGTAQKPDQCVKGVWPDNRPVMRQCRRKRGHGPGGFWCRVHAPVEKSNGE